MSKLGQLGHVAEIDRNAKSSPNVAELGQVLPKSVKFGHMLTGSGQSSTNVSRIRPKLRSHPTRMRGSRPSSVKITSHGWSSSAHVGADVGRVRAGICRSWSNAGRHLVDPSPDISPKSVEIEPHSPWQAAAQSELGGAGGVEPSSKRASVNVVVTSIGAHRHPTKQSCPASRISCDMPLMHANSIGAAATPEHGLGENRFACSKRARSGWCRRQCLGEW